MSSSDDFFKGLLFGAVIGATAGILLAPKSGSETREEIKKFSTDLQDKAQELYYSSRKEVEERLRDLKAAGKRIDIDAYKKLVSKVTVRGAFEYVSSTTSLSCAYAKRGKKSV